MTTDHIGSAKPARTPMGSGAPKVVAEGVLSALRPDPRMEAEQGLGRVFFGLRVVAPWSWDAVASGTAACHTGIAERRNAS
ncbi:hypothetical protein [Streptomyces kronopolitis]